jgi:ADP-ribosylglycohydrolase/predicted enzyme related to lactoylglutathione lyase
MMESPESIYDIQDKITGSLLGLAIGDALGWPSENRSMRIRPVGSETALGSFFEWSRKPGGFYYAHEEIIQAGEYSDDTQLALAVARASCYGQKWWDVFVNCELPSWTLYERGGGGATKRSAESWLNGTPPWNARKGSEVLKYFNAGGNGVAMRIVPHCIVGVGKNSFSPVASYIMHDGIATHGHPRALVGALAFGYAVWISLRNNTTLTYGSIIDDLLKNAHIWSAMPDISSAQQNWWLVADAAHKEGYSRTWMAAVSEMLALLRVCREAIDQGSLSIDKETLTNLGCFDSKIGGAGTVAAAAAIFLASRHAISPVAGMLEAVLAEGIDSDTIASMTASLLGSIVGSSWLGEYSVAVQDANYIAEVGCELVNRAMTTDAIDIEVPPIRSSDKALWIERLRGTKIGDKIQMLDGRIAIVMSAVENRSFVRSSGVKTWKVRSLDGQTLYFKKAYRKKSMEVIERSKGTQDPHSSSNFVRAAIKLPVSNLQQSRDFYVNVLGMTVTKESGGYVNLSGSIALLPMSDAKSFTDISSNPIRALLYLEMRSIDSIYCRVQAARCRILSNMSTEGKRRCFRILDPDNNIIEIYEPNSDKGNLVLSW